MNLKIAIVLSLMLLAVTKNFAQVTGITEQKLSFTISYYGNMLIKPGIKAGADYVITQKRCSEKERKKAAANSMIKQLVVSGDVGSFWHPHSHVAIFNYYTLNYRIVKPTQQKFNTIGLGPGIYRSVYPETYEVDDSGEISPVSMAGRFYFAPVLVLGTGKFMAGKTIQSWHFNTNIMFLCNYNTGVVPLLSFDIGIGFSFNKNKFIR